MMSIIFGFFALLFLFFIWLTWNNDYWLKQRIAYVDPVLLFGNIRDVILMKRTIGDVYKDIYSQLNGKELGGFFKLRQPILMARSPNVIRQVLEEKFDCFSDNDIEIRSDAEHIIKMNPFLAKGQKWKPIRQMVERSLKISKLEIMTTHISAICQRMINFIKTQSYRPINIEEMSGMFMTDVFASCSFGKEINSFAGEPEFRRMTKRLFNSGIKSNLAILFAFYAPFLGHLLKFRITGKRLAKFFTDVVTDICKQRVTQFSEREDFLQKLIDINKESQAFGEGQVYSFEEIAGHCLTFIVDGYYPMAESLAFCLYELAKNPNQQRKARECVLKVTSNYQLLKYEDYNSSLTYLDLVIKESYRLHPSFQTITRVCVKDTVLNADGFQYMVKKGTPITVPITALHVDPEHFSDPLDFKPERFQDEPKPFTYIPYGAGPRICPAIEFSNILLKMALSSILSKYILTPRDNSPIILDPQNSFLRTPKGGVWVNFKPI